MKNKRSRLWPARFVADKLRSLDFAFCRLYDNSLFSHFSSTLRRKFMTLSTRVAGVFFFTFGIYSFLIAFLMKLFSERSADPSSLYGGAAMIVACIPLLFSKGNISTILTDSAFGGVICYYLNIRKETLDTSTHTGHLSIAFVLGVIAGGSTVVFPLSYIVFAMLLVLTFAVILSLPEAGITLMTVLLFVTGIELQYVILGATAISYVFKLIRRKRRLSFKKTDAVLVIFALCALFGVIVADGEDTGISALKYSLLLIAYFLCICLVREREKLLKVLYAAIMSAGIISSFYICARALRALVSTGFLVEPDYLYNVACALPAIESGFAPFAFAVLTPLCCAFIIKASSDGYRFTSCLCLASMLGYLLLSGELAFALAGAVATTFFLFVTGSRWVYVSISAVLGGSVILAFSGSFGDRIYRYVMSSLSDAFNQARDMSYISSNTFSREYALWGHGFNGFEDTGSNFYYSLVSHLGIAGFVILCVFVLFVLAEATVITIKTYRTSQCDEAMSRFPSIGSPAETRACTLALSCSIIVCIICATFCNFFTNPSTYLMFFMLCAFCAAYARSAKDEIGNAEGALSCNQSSDRYLTKL